MTGSITETVAPGSVEAHDLPRLAPGTVVGGRYRVNRFLGSGGSAIVYAAFDTLLNEPVALKVLRPDRSGEIAAARLRREVSLAHQVANEHVVRVHDIGRDEHGLFVTMELVDGESLRDRIARGSLSIGDALDVALSLLDGLEAIHRAGIVHRDVKPSNVLIDPDGFVKLADLGIARSFDPEEMKVTASDAVVGTLEYLSPEQARGKPAEARSDLYSFGLLLFECLTGELPYGDRSSVGVILAHVRERPRDVRKLRRDVPRWLAAIIAKLLEKKPARRFASAAAVARAIRGRRAPVNWRGLAWGAAIFLLVLTGTAVAQRLMSRRPVVSIAQNGDRGFRAIDENGRVLWTREGVPATFVTVLRNRKRDTVVVLPDGLKPHPARVRARLTLLDAETGELIRSVRLPNADADFPDFRPEFANAPPEAVDLDHDGNEEVVISYVHTFYPSYTVFYDPRSDQARVISVSSGHQRFVGTADVDADGRDEVLLAGVNNRMGWYRSLAAVGVPAVDLRFGTEAAYSPDKRESGDERRILHWYTLLPAGGSAIGVRARVDTARRTIEIPFDDADVARIGFDGFVLDGRPAPPVKARKAARAEAYRLLRLAQGALERPDRETEAVRLTEDAIARAHAANDRVLEEWALRLRANVLIRVGRVDDALKVIDSPLLTPESKPDVQYDLALELHRRGDLERAVPLYVAGARAKTRSPRRVGRLRYEFVEGAVLALCELRQYGRAREVAAEFVDSSRDDGDTDTYLRYAGLLAGTRTFDERRTGRGLDLDRYVDTEVDALTMQDARALLSRVEQAIARNDSVRGGYESLAGELYRQIGDRVKARQMAQAALRWIEANRASSLFARAHAEFVRKRAAAAGVGAP